MHAVGGVEVRYNSWERCVPVIVIPKIVPPFFFVFFLLVVLPDAFVSLPYSETIVVLGFVCAAVWFV